MILVTVSSLENLPSWLHGISRSSFTALNDISLCVYHSLWFSGTVRIIKYPLQNSLIQRDGMSDMMRKTVTWDPRSLPLRFVWWLFTSGKARLLQHFLTGTSVPKASRFVGSLASRDLPEFGELVSFPFIFMFSPPNFTFLAYKMGITLPSSTPNKGNERSS